MGGGRGNSEDDPMSTPELRTADILSAQRTRLAAERTLMGWVRTSISMISFGFTITKALQFAEEGGVVKGVRAGSAERVGLTLIILAVVSLSFACIQHWSFVRKLPATGARGRPWDLTLVMAGIIATLGLLIFANLVFRVGPL